MISSPTTYIDPVCGMTVTPAAAKGLRWKGRNYYFCEVACSETFLEDPERWDEPMEHVDEAVSH